MNELKIAAVGDIMLGDKALRAGNGVRSMALRRGADFIFERVRPFLSGNDLVFGNLEAVLSDRGLNPCDLASSSYRGLPGSAGALRRAGFSVVSVANNHMLDHGREAFDDTLRELEGAGIRPVGRPEGSGECDPVVFDLAGRRIGFLGYLLAPRGSIGSGRRDGMLSAEVVIEGVGRTARSVDILIVSLHWGYEYMAAPSPEQIALAHRAMKAGAKVIIGHHPHCLQGMEEYGGGLILYSLGNFVFDYWQRYLRYSMMVRIRIGESGSPAFDCLPVLINRSFQPVVLEGVAEREGLKRRLNKLSNLIEESARLSGDRYLASVKARQRRWRNSNRLYFLLRLWKFRPKFWAQAARRFCYYLSKRRA